MKIWWSNSIKIDLVWNGFWVLLKHSKNNEIHFTEGCSEGCNNNLFFMSEFQKTSYWMKSVKYVESYLKLTEPFQNNTNMSGQNVLSNPVLSDIRFKKHLLRKGSIVLSFFSMDYSYHGPKSKYLLSNQLLSDELAALKVW